MATPEKWMIHTIEKFMQSNSHLLPRCERLTPTVDQLKVFVKNFINTNALSYDGRKHRTYNEALVGDVSGNPLLMGLKVWLRDTRDLSMKIITCTPVDTSTGGLSSVPISSRAAPPRPMTVTIVKPQPQAGPPPGMGGFAPQAGPPPGMGGLAQHMGPTFGGPAPHIGAPIGAGGVHPSVPPAGKITVPGSMIMPIFDVHTRRLAQLEESVTKILQANDVLEVMVDELKDKLAAKDMAMSTNAPAIQPSSICKDTIPNLKHKVETLARQLEREKQAKFNPGLKPKTEEEQRAELEEQEKKITRQLEAVRARGQPKPKSFLERFVYTPEIKRKVWGILHSIGAIDAPPKAKK